MAVDARSDNVTGLYREVMWKMYTLAETRESERGPVFQFPTPMVVRLEDITQRGLIAPVRRPNPVFHVMEAIWMLAGERRVNWLLQFNKGYADFAEPDGSVWGAYGHRWRYSFRVDQIRTALAVLEKSKISRRAVIAMWDPEIDLGRNVRDRPCNTHLYLQIKDNRLNMMVCNRSNDIVWGMLGSNIVHFPMLQELMAKELGVIPGYYEVHSMNAHVYTQLYDGVAYMDEARTLLDTYSAPLPLLQKGESIVDFIIDCEYMVMGENKADYITLWMRTVAEPMRQWWNNRTSETLDKVQCPMWHQAIVRWLEGPQ